MKILIANPPCRIDLGNGQERYFVRSGSRWPFSVLKDKDKPAEYIPFPFYLAYTAALLLKDNFEVSVIDAVALNLTLEGFIEQSARSKADIIVFETTTPTIANDLKLAGRLKDEMPAFIVFAGTHATVFPEHILESSKSVDFVLLGEYELNFLDLARHVLNNKDVSGIKGIAYRKGTDIVINRNSELTDLSLLPFPTRELFPSNEYNNLDIYWDAFCQNKPAIQMHSSRGCPIRCNFCLWNQVMYGNGKYRMFSARRVVDEMVYCINKFGAREIYFDDDSFTVNKKHVLDICEEIKDRRLRIKWSAMADTIFLDEEMIDTMSSSGCIGIKFGVESGNRQILDNISKPIDFEKVKRIAAYCAKKRIKTHATFTFGLSGETLDTARDTMNFAKELDADSVQFSINTPFPGTRYYEELKSSNRIITEDWSAYDGACSSVIKSDSFSNKELENICSSATSVWLKYKIRHPLWLKREIFNLFRLIKGQGPKSFFDKLKRAGNLILK